MLRYALRQFIQCLIDLFRRQVLVIVEVDLKHRRCAARAETFDFTQRETPVSRSLADFDPELLRTMFGDFPRAHDLARERLADLYVILPDRLRVDHRVERRDFPDVRNAQLQAASEIEHARRIEITTLALHNEH